MQHVPIVTMRVHSVKDVPVDQLRSGAAAAIRALTREYRCAIATRSASETLVEGQWHGSVGGDTTYISERGIAGNLGVTIGDSIVFDVQGVLIPSLLAAYASDWQRVMPNFFAVFPTDILEAAPQFHVLVTRFGQSEQLAQLQRRSIAATPTYRLSTSTSSSQRSTPSWTRCPLSCSYWPSLALPQACSFSWALSRRSSSACGKAFCCTLRQAAVRWVASWHWNTSSWGVCSADGIDAVYRFSLGSVILRV